MKISKIVLSNFRCFGPEPTVIDFDMGGPTTLIGSNAAGKTAVLQALVKVFGSQGGQARIQRDDFHCQSGQTLNEETSLFIEAWIAFPEIASATTEANSSGLFNFMISDAENGPLYCRIRLEAMWSQSTSVDGIVEDNLYWITTTVDPIPDEHKHRVRLQERRQLNVWYVPAARDPATQLRNMAGTMMEKVLRSVNWSVSPADVIAKAAEQVQVALTAEKGILLFHDIIGTNWQNLHDTSVYSRPQLKFLGSDTDSIIKQAAMMFSPSEGGDEHDIDRLSEGQKSLFYLALVATICDLEQSVLQPRADTDDSSEPPVLLHEELAPPALSILAVEEPENHLAPHYLSRITELLSRISRCSNMQVIITSHSPAIVGRIDPVSIRHCRLDGKSGASVVRAIRLPPDTDTAYKYVREAVQAYPELYFARVVVLGEGDSEEIVLPKLAAASSIPIQASFVSIVPLGGRFVNHFWRLLNDLEIPHITLLDLDCERHGGGWGRIKGALTQLIECGHDCASLLTVTMADGKQITLDSDDLTEMHKRNVSEQQLLNAFIVQLEQNNVYFSQPLDLDMMMLSSFEKEYCQVLPEQNGPRFPQDADKRSKKVAKDVELVLGDGAMVGATYPVGMADLFSWYAFLFLRKGKPSTHLFALSQVPTQDLCVKTPEPLKRLLNGIQSMLKAAERQNNDTPNSPIDVEAL